MKKIVINRSYRNTLEIGKFSAKLLGLKDILFLERHGKDVEEQTFHGIDGLLSAALENLSQSYETAAILTMTEEDAHDLYRLVKARHGEKKMPVHYIDRNSTAFEKGLTVTTYYLAKGLEFDQVFTAFPDKKHPFLQQASYISATRALHELYIYRFERF